jgi:mRNA-degrading endonuclease YafQ of YafQ-DinJ toxin-antitoxin module
MRIFYSPKFAREYKKLPKKIRVIAEEREDIFRNNPFDPILQTHKLHSRLKDFWSFSLRWGSRCVSMMCINEEANKPGSRVGARDDRRTERES